MSFPILTGNPLKVILTSKALFSPLLAIPVHGLAMPYSHSLIKDLFIV